MLAGRQGNPDWPIGLSGSSSTAGDQRREGGEGGRASKLAGAPWTEGLVAVHSPPIGQREGPLHRSASQFTAGKKKFRPTRCKPA